VIVIEFFSEAPSLDLSATMSSASSPQSPLAHRSNNFDLIRLIAALQVVVTHAIGHTGLREKLPEWQRQIFDLMVWLPGVPIFFVISGFLISRSYERNKGDLVGYFWNRSLRIFPALWVCLGVTLILLGMFGFLPLSFLKSGTFIAWLVGQVSFIQFFNPDQFRAFGIGVANGALWTITVEFQYYLFIPILYATIYRNPQRRKLAAILLALLFSVSYAAYCVMNVKLTGPEGFTGAPIAFKLLFNTLIPHLWMFMVGIFIHRNFDRLRGWLEGRVLIYLGAYAVIAALMQWLIPPSSVPFYVCLLPARILLGFATIAAAYSAKSLSGILLRGTDISYGIYIYHMLVINYFVEKGWLDSLSDLPWVIGIAVIFAMLSWHLVEKTALSCKSVSPRAILTRFMPSKSKPG
jgi:peptidoglycan/LPS O-acetylase OafA/YrhL